MELYEGYDFVTVTIAICCWVSVFIKYLVCLEEDRVICCCR